MYSNRCIHRIDKYKQNQKNEDKYIRTQYAI